MKKTTIIFLLPVLFFIGCISSQLNSNGARVQYVIKEEAPKGYTMIGTVEIDEFDSGKTYPDAIVRLRNKAGEIGGDFLVIDDIQYHDIDITLYYSGTGRVYKKK
jgi:hypothetical protein